MKKVLLTLLVCIPAAFLFAQNCDPDPAFQDQTGVFPMPYDADLSPDGGISECAVIGESYDFTLTVGVGDSITINQGGLELRLELDKITIESVTGLPIGINVVYEPSDAVFPAGSIGCAKLTGVPTSDNMPGDYELLITAKVSFTSPLIPDQTLTFPDSTFAPGVYTLRVLADANDVCDVVATNEKLSDKLAMTSVPNPVSGIANIKINADVFGEFNLHVVDLLGQSVETQQVRVQEGVNNIPMDFHQLANGFYFLVLENELGRIAQKITVQH